MTEQQILNKAIAKVIKNGYAGIHLIEYALGAEGHLGALAKHGLIFTHDFAKAFWGTKKTRVWIKPRIYNTYAHQAPIHRKGFWVMRGNGTGWKKHLQNMVIAENPLNYLRRFLK